MRSQWKFKYVNPSLYYQFHKYNELCYEEKEHNDSINLNESQRINVNSFEVWSRSSTILPEFINSTVEIYNGSKFISVKLEHPLVNHKFGEFAYSKKLGPTIHILGKKKKQKKK